MTQPLLVYIAGRYERRAELHTLAQRLGRKGKIKVTSRWLDGSHDQAPPDLCAAHDLEDIEAAHGLLSFTEGPDVGYVRGGRHVEFGWAAARGKSLWIVGPRENVFHHLHRVRVFSTVEEWARYLEVA